jgi:hypothetical protein
MEEDIAFDPVNVLFFGVVGIVLEADDIADPIKEIF